MILLKDVIHLYLGCECEVGNNTGKITAVQSKPFVQAIFRDNEDSRMGHFVNIENVKPILRPLSDMTEEDLPGWFKKWMPQGFEVFHQYSNNFHYIEIDSNADDGFCLTIHDDGSMHCECKDNGEQYGYRGAEIFNHLLSRHFDLFGLIETNQAIKK